MSEERPTSLERAPDVERRAQAARLFAEGRSQADVARRLGVSRVTALSWHRRYCHEGEAGLVRPRPRGRTADLDPALLGELERALCAGPGAAGLPGAGWTLATVALLLEQRFGVRHHRGHVWRVLRALGWQLPGRQRSSWLPPTARTLLVADPDGNDLRLRDGC